MAGIYLHIPFCKQRCVYCDFYFVTTVRDPAPFVDALCREIADYGERFGGREPIDTIYVGGGTPSLLAPDDVARILSALGDHFDTRGVRETTFELNPDDGTPAYLDAIRSAGVDRLSIGIQSFFEEDLRWMNRAHSSTQARAIVPMARQAGFTNYSIDLIFGLPAQPPDRWHANLNIALELEAPHLSTYGLTVEPRTPLGNRVKRGVEPVATEEVMAERYRETMHRLRTAGYDQYEISSFALPGRHSRHNQLYWRHANYLGFGPAAHAFWWDESGPRRWANARSLRRYLETGGQAVDMEEALDPDTLANEYIMLRLRTREGLDLVRLRERYGRDLAGSHTADLARFAAEGWVEFSESHLHLTDAGFLLCDALTVALIT
ncbi:MAG: radical SAM family heme chaperone HemW [Rhodothermales bacterium]|nr:radical SAM family heme chaperone HemW [Rhodothermales bacterium]